MSSSTHTRVGGVVGAAMLIAGLVAPAAAQTPPADADFSASATGTVIHAEALEQPELQDPESTRAVDSEVAFSSALVDTTGLSEDRFNEWGGLVMPAQDGKNAYGRGYGVDVAFGEPGGTDEPQIRQAGLAEAAAPPETGPVVEEIGPLDGSPLAYASTLRGTAYAQPADACVLGSDLSTGQGYVEDAELIDTAADEETEGLDAPILATNAADPTRAVSWSNSRTFLHAQTNAEGERIGDDIGVVSETRQTIAPVTFFAGTEAEFTLEFAGEWVLRAHAGGIPGSAYVHYGPGEVSPETPILSIIQGDEVTRIITTQDLLGDEGLEIPIGEGEDMLANIVIGEDPRAIGGGTDSEPTAAGDGTAAAGAVDVARVQLLSSAGVGEAAEVRIGHMEVSAAVPAGGLDCDLPVEKSVDKALVQPGDDFVYTIRVSNPYDCTLHNVRVVDDLTADDGVTWTVTGSDPEPDELTDTRIVWNDVGPIEPGASATLTVDVSVDDDSAAGFFHDDAAATAECFDQPVEGEDDAPGGVGIPLEGGASLDLPEVRIPAAAAPPALPRTGGGVLVSLAGLALVGAAGVLWRRRR